MTGQNWDGDTIPNRISINIPLCILTASLFLLVAIFQNKSSFKHGKDKKGKITAKNISGPKPSWIPFVGNALQLLPIQDTIKNLILWGIEQGPIFQVKIVGLKIVFLNSPAYVQALLKSPVLEHVQKNSIYEMAEPLVQKDRGLFMTKGMEWKQQRKHLTKLMTPKCLRGYMSLLNKGAKRLITSIENQFTSEKMIEDIDEIVNVAFFELICEFSTGVDIHGTNDGKEFHHVTKAWEILVAKRAFEPWLLIPFIWRLHPAYNQQEKNIAQIKQTIHKLIAKHKEQKLGMKNVQDEYYMRSLLDELTEQELDDELIREEVFLMMMAGHDTSATTLITLLFYLALNPDIKEKCQQEVDDVFNKPGYVTEEGLSFESLSELKYLEWCICEALRIFPPIFVIGRELGAPLTLDSDLELPQGTIILISPIMMHRNPKYYPNPEQFNPKRFCPEDQLYRDANAYFPFSGGTRNCFGFKFAMMEIKVAGANIIRNFDFSTVDTPESVGMMPNVLLTPARPHLFSFWKRQLAST